MTLVMQVDPLKLGTNGVKRPFDEKTDKIQELIANQKRYYPVDRQGNIDEWGAVIKQQMDNHTRAVEAQKQQERQRLLNYGEDLRLEQQIREKHKEIEKYDKFNDLDQVNRIKAEYDGLLEQQRQRQAQVKVLMAEDYKKSIQDHHHEQSIKKRMQLSEEHLANERVQRELDALKQIEHHKQRTIKEMLLSDIDERKKFNEYEHLLREHQRGDANRLIGENSNFNIGMCQEGQYSKRYAQVQDQQKPIMNNYYQTVKGPQIESRVQELERIKRDAELKNKQQAQEECLKEQLKREYVSNNRQLLMRQLEDKSKLQYLERELQGLDLQEIQNQHSEFRNYKQLKESAQKQKKHTYKEMLDNQVNVQKQFKLYGNMTNVEKQLNKMDLQAYKNYDNHQYAMVPGLHTLKDNQPALYHSPKDKKSHHFEENQKRLDQYGYGRGYMSQLKQGNQTSRGLSLNPVAQQIEHIEKTTASTLENPLNHTLDRKAHLRRSALLDVGLQAMHNGYQGNPLSQSYDPGSRSMARNQSMGALNRHQNGVQNQATQQWYQPQQLKAPYLPFADTSTNNRQGTSSPFSKSPGAKY